MKMPPRTYRATHVGQALDLAVAEFIHKRLLAYVAIPAGVYQVLAAHDWGCATQ